MCIVCIATNINRNMYMYPNTRIFPTTGYERVLLFMFKSRELGGTGTGCLFQFTYCDPVCLKNAGLNNDTLVEKLKNVTRITPDLRQSKKLLPIQSRD